MQKFPDVFLYASPSSDHATTTWVLQLASQKAMAFTKDRTSYTPDEDNRVFISIPYEDDLGYLEAMEALIGPFEDALRVHTVE